MGLSIGFQNIQVVYLFGKLIAQERRKDPKIQLNADEPMSAVQAQIVVLAYGQWC